MSLRAIGFLLAFAGLSVLSARRAAYGFLVYVLPVFMAPGHWWWGHQARISWYRWSFTAGAVFLGAVLVQCVREGRVPDIDRRVMLVGAALICNATFVHFLLAPVPAISMEAYGLLIKFVALCLMIQASVRNERDFQLMAIGLALISCYTGYETTLGVRRGFSGGRFEGAGIAGATTANQYASLLVMILPLIGSLILLPRLPARIAGLVSAPLNLNMFLYCNSRGGFLGIIAAGATFFMTASGRARRHALIALLLGALAGYNLLGDDEIVARFWSIFVSSEQRDASAQSRVLFWQAGMMMVRDHPFGSGGDGYKRVYGSQYLLQLGIKQDVRAVHNGYINDATTWGIQGLALRLVFIGIGVLAAFRVVRLAKRRRDPYDGVLGAALIASFVGFAVTCMFGDFLDSEWAFWLVGLAVAKERLAREAVAAAETQATVASTPDVAAPRPAVPVPRFTRQESTR
jgi:putative inorganic carbon (hco3(-)) transporter